MTTGQNNDEQSVLVSGENARGHRSLLGHRPCVDWQSHVTSVTDRRSRNVISGCAAWAELLRALAGPDRITDRDYRVPPTESDRIGDGHHRVDEVVRGRAFWDARAIAGEPYPSFCSGLTVH